MAIQPSSQVFLPPTFDSQQITNHLLSVLECKEDSESESDIVKCHSIHRHFVYERIFYLTQRNVPTEKSSHKIDFTHKHSFDMHKCAICGNKFRQNTLNLVLCKSKSAHNNISLSAQTYLLLKSDFHLKTFSFLFIFLIFIK